MDIQRHLDRPDLTKKRYGYIGGGIVLLLLLLYSIFAPRASLEVEKDNIFIDTVRKGDMVRVVSGIGLLIPTETRLIPSSVQATVDSILVQAGSEVDPDTVMLSLVNKDVDNQYDEKNFNLM